MLDELREADQKKEVERLKKLEEQQENKLTLAQKYLNKELSAIEKQIDAEKEQEENESTIVPDDTEQKQNAQDMAQALTPAEQKEKEWMDKVQFDAGRVLRYRLAKQYQE